MGALTDPVKNMRWQTEKEVLPLSKWRWWGTKQWCTLSSSWCYLVFSDYWNPHTIVTYIQIIEGCVCNKVMCIIFLQSPSKSFWCFQSCNGLKNENLCSKNDSKLYFCFFGRYTNEYFQRIYSHVDCFFFWSKKLNNYRYSFNEFSICANCKRWLKHCGRLW